MITNKPKVSVCVVTYNHQEYVGRCLQSLADQSTSFDYEIIVSDDCSVDKTREIILQYAEKYPAIIRPILRDKNIGAFENYKQTHRLARGLYVAHCDGDDYSLPGKLQALAELLDTNPEASMAAHRMFLEAGSCRVGATQSNPSLISQEYLVKHHPCFLNSATMYRKNMAGGLFDSKEDFIDFYTYVFLSSVGNIAFSNNIYGIYAVGVGISAGLNLIDHINAALDLAAKNGITDELIKEAKARQLMSYALGFLARRNDEKYRSMIELAKSYHSASRSINILYAVRMLPTLMRFFLNVLRVWQRFVGKMRVLWLMAH